MTLLSRIHAFELGSAPASGAVAGASPATIWRIKHSHRSVSGDAAVPHFSLHSSDLDENEEGKIMRRQMILPLTILPSHYEH